MFVAKHFFQIMTTQSTLLFTIPANLSNVINVDVDFQTLETWVVTLWLTQEKDHSHAMFVRKVLRLSQTWRNTSCPSITAAQTKAAKHKYETELDNMIILVIAGIVFKKTVDFHFSFYIEFL